MFIYQEYSPNTILARYIDKYWVADGYEAKIFEFKVLPDGCIDIIFSWDDSTGRETMEEGVPYIIGGGTGYLTESMYGRIRMFGIRFLPTGIRAFIRTPADEVTGGLLPLRETENAFDTGLLDVIGYGLPLAEQVVNVERYLLNRLIYTYPIEKRIAHATHLIGLHNGNMNMTDLATDICLSTRQFERLFRIEVGMSAKSFSRIMRMKYTKEYLKLNPERSLFEVAIDCGYYDYAHLKKEFVTLTGDLPSYFI